MEPPKATKDPLPLRNPRQLNEATLEVRSWWWMAGRLQPREGGGQLRIKSLEDALSGEPFPDDCDATKLIARLSLPRHCHIETNRRASPGLRLPRWIEYRLMSCRHRLPFLSDGKATECLNSDSLREDLTRHAVIFFVQLREDGFSRWAG
jgi:hypothetical protein